MVAVPLLELAVVVLVVVVHAADLPMADLEE